jgi:hypothetical protein
MGIGTKAQARFLNEGIEAIRREFMENGSPEDVAIMEYILDHPAKEEEEGSNDGHSIAMRDKGHAGMYLKDFLAFGGAVTANLEDTHVAALRRLYTSQAYKCINDPLRSCTKHHPFAATTLFVSEALKKLRSVSQCDGHESVEAGGFLARYEGHRVDRGV